MIHASSVNFETHRRRYASHAIHGKERGERTSEIIFLLELIPSFIQGPKHTGRNHALLGGSIGWKLIIKQSASPSYIE